jgi:hypothetical protein
MDISMCGSPDDDYLPFIVVRAAGAMSEKTGGRSGLAGIFIVLMTAVPLYAVVKGCW